MSDLVVLEDEHRVPTQLGERVPMLPFLFPFDWTQRQVYWVAMWFWMGTMQGGWANLVAYTAIGLLGVMVEYMARPSPEFWISTWLEYLTILAVSFPLWWKRLLPGHSHVDWPMATLPHWLGHRLMRDVEVLNDGVLRIRGRPGRPPKFAVVLGIRPRPHPDMLPMLVRQAIVETRLGIFKLIRGEWSLHLQVRLFDAYALEVASGPAWEWVQAKMASRMVRRRPSLVLYGDTSEALREQAEAVLERFRNGLDENATRQNRPAWLQSAAEARKLMSELWADTGLSSTGRVRIGVRRVVTGLRKYRSWVLTVLPGVIHLSWLRPLTSESLLCDVAMHVSRRPPAATRRSLQRRIRQWRAVDRDQDYAHAVEDAQRVVNAMRRGIDTEVMVGMYVTAREEQAAKVAEKLETTQCEFAPADVYQHRALRSTRTLGGDSVNRKMHADLRTVATTDLMATAGYWPDGATLVGEGLSAPEPIGLNPFDENNLNWAMFIACMQGAGKTTTAQVLAWRMANPHPHHPLADTDVRVVSIDFKKSGDYANLYRNLDARGHPASYNPWSGGALPAIGGHIGFNLSDVPEHEHGDRLVELTERLEDWSESHSHESQMLLILDEILALMEAPGGLSFIRRFGTQGRSLRIAPVFCTQDVEVVMANHKAGLALKNCATIFLGRQNPAGINTMAPLLSLEREACMQLATAPQGAGILRIERQDGPVVLGLQVRPTEWELREFGTNPSERIARWRRTRDTVAALLESKEVHEANGHEHRYRDLAGAGGTAFPAAGDLDVELNGVGV
jgi:hypothetical protein